MDKVFAVIVNYNQTETTKKCVESLLKEAPEINIFIVDNGSTNDSFIFLKEFSNIHNIEILRSEKNLGFGAGANIGVKEALLRGADFILILNNDIIFEHNFLEPLLKEIKKGEKIGIVCPKIVFLNNGNKIWYLGGKIDFLQLKVLHNFENKKNPFETDFASGCAMMVKKEVFERIGFFKEKYFMFFEDADFSFLAKKAGFKIITVPASKIYHKESLTIRKSPLKTYYLVRNGLLFGRENYPPFLMPWLYYNFFIRSVFNFGKSLFNPQSEEIKAVSEGLNDFIKKRWGQK